MSYQVVPIGEVVTLRQGFAINKHTKHHMSDEPTSLYLLRIGDMKEKSFNTYVKDTIPSHFIAKESDIIYTRTGQVGLVFKNQYGVIHNNCFTVTPIDDHLLDREFLYYVLSSPEFYQEANSKATGAAQLDLSHAAFLSITIPLPKKCEQIRIAKTLSSFDKLIDNDQKQIKLLEEAAQRLYKEWFIDLRFPGHETTPIVNGIPEGWSKTSVGNLISYEIGGGWGEESRTRKCDKEAYVIRGTDFQKIMQGDIFSIPFRYHTTNNLSARILQNEDIVFEVSGGSRTEGVARCLMVTSEMLETWGKSVMCASFCKLIRPKAGFSYYLYSSLKYMRANGITEEYDKRSASSIVNFRWKDFLSSAELLQPEENIMGMYNEIAKKYYTKIVNCSLRIESAKNARDRLLPKLMNGEIEV